MLKSGKNLIIPAVFTGHEVENGVDIKALIEQFDLDGQIYCLGYVDENIVNVLYRHARLLCFPSKFEGFGMPVLEAMQLGCPVACSRTTSLPEVCGDAALYFNPDDPIEIASVIQQLWQSDSLRMELSSRGLARAQMFSSENMAAVHLSAFTYAYNQFAKKRQNNNVKYVVYVKNIIKCGIFNNVSNFYLKQKIEKVIRLVGNIYKKVKL
jgi:hypothetical protein